MSQKKIIAWDLGTGGNKASLYNIDGECLAESFTPYDTAYPNHGWHEQKPDDWWNAVKSSTKELLSKSNVDKDDIYCCGISGHSLGTVPIDADGNLLRASTPIWSDSRAQKQAAKFFENYDEEKWYSITGNGFPAPLYSVFKILWYRDNEPDMFSKIHKIIGTKDYVNFKLTGQITTDPSYASGCGVYDLNAWNYSEELIKASGLSPEIFPEIVPSTQVIGSIKPEIAEEIGLNPSVKVVSGGVDNSCMALGALAYKEGRTYNSLGSSCWIAVSSEKPLIDVHSRPYVFTHVVPGMFASALCIVSGGTSYRWVRDFIAIDLVQKANAEGKDVYDLMQKEAETSTVGANKLIFNPSLGGGMPIDKSSNIRGGWMGLDLTHTRADMIRSALEGISVAQRVCLDELKKLTTLSDKMLLVGGGSKSDLWRQIYADAYNMTVVKTNIDQQAAALGAAAVAAVGTGLWDDFERLDQVHADHVEVRPIKENAETFEKRLPLYKNLADGLSDLGDAIVTL